MCVYIYMICVCIRECVVDRVRYFDEIDVIEILYKANFNPVTSMVSIFLYQI